MITTKMRKKQIHKRTRDMSADELLRHRWSDIRGRKYDPGYKSIEVKISREEFLEEFNNEDFRKLYAEWARAGKPRYLAPSIDRIDPNGHYELVNMRWLSLSDNVRRARRPRHRSRPVMQLTRRGILLAGYPSVALAARITGYEPSNISSAACGRIPSSAGFLWKYVDGGSVTTPIPTH